MAHENRHNIFVEDPDIHVRTKHFIFRSKTIVNVIIFSSVFFLGIQMPVIIFETDERRRVCYVQVFKDVKTWIPPKYYEATNERKFSTMG